MVTHEEYKKALEIVISYKKSFDDNYEKLKADLLRIPNPIITKDTKIWDTHIGTRAKNLIRAAYDNIGWDSTVKDLEGIDIKKLYGLRNAGKKSIKEVIELCHLAGIKINNNNL